MNDTDRHVYPKIAKKAKLDSLLQWGSLTPQQLAAIQEQLKGQMRARTNQPGGKNKSITFAVRTSAAGATVATVSTTAAITLPSLPLLRKNNNFISLNISFTTFVLVFH
jgi:hypothetical protein